MQHAACMCLFGTGITKCKCYALRCIQVGNGTDKQKLITTSITVLLSHCAGRGIRGWTSWRHFCFRDCRHNLMFLVVPWKYGLSPTTQLTLNMEFGIDTCIDTFKTVFELQTRNLFKDAFWGQCHGRLMDSFLRKERRCPHGEGTAPLLLPKGSRRPAVKGWS